MADKQFDAETIYNMLADALYNALGTDSAKLVRDRVLGTLKPADRKALETLIAEKRKGYAKPE